MNVLKLELAMQEKGINNPNEYLQELLEISYQGLRRRLTCKVEFTRKEISKIIEALELSEESAIEIFFKN
jgi:hypothetical protein